MTATATQMARKAGAVELPGGQIQFANALQLAVFRHYCNVQARHFATAEPPRPLATLHVDGAEVRAEWHQAGPIEGEVEVYAAPVLTLTAAARDVLAERQRQISAEGWTPEYDDQHNSGDMAFAAACYATATPEGFSDIVQWPWAAKWWKPAGPRRNLVKAAALILAEIERLDRAGMPESAR